MKIKEFKKWLLNQNLAENTISSYIYAIEEYSNKYKKIQKELLLSYKGLLVEKNKAKTVNLRLQGINKYLEFLGENELKMKFVKIPQKSFLENVISNSDYEFLKNKLKKDDNLNWYFIVRYLGATGARISELISIKIEHVNQGYIDLYTKGGKIRRIYIPKKLKIETEKWLSFNDRTSGYLFLNKNNKQISTRGIAHQLKELARKYNMNEKVVYPHSFRHLYGKNFITKYKDIALLADLMGHDSIETTRIYLRRTSEEQQNIVDKIVTW